jgi:hypothetical protein
VGLPVVVVVTEAFAMLAQRIAAAEGRPDLPVLVLPYPLEGLPAAQVQAVATDAFPRLLELLGMRAP